MQYKFVTSEKRSKIMKLIKSSNTEPEIQMRKMLWRSGIRYRLYDETLPGKPDIVIKKHKIAVFIDGEFWHGFQWNRKKNKIKANRDYWIPKIERTIERDKKNNQLLEERGWTVVRYWTSEVQKNQQNCLEKITSLIKEKRSE
ncbi:very short patch repair endonuclease [Chloroflexota bacterium]